MIVSANEFDELIQSPAWKAVEEHLKTYEQACFRQLAVATEMSQVYMAQAAIRAVAEVLKAPHKLKEQEVQRGKQSSEGNHVVT